VEINTNAYTSDHFVSSLRKKHLFIHDGWQIEETILESLAWRSDSPLWDAIQLCGNSLSVEEVFFVLFYGGRYFSFF